MKKSKLLLAILLLGGRIAYSKVQTLEFKYVAINKNVAFENKVRNSLDQVLDFSNKNKLGIKQPSEFIKSAVMYGTKRAFDEMMYASGWPKNQSIPKNYVGVGQNKVFHVVSWEVYKEIYPKDSKDDYQKLITHEISHLFHITYLKGQEDHMGPRWFYEGFACLVANQYEDSIMPSKETIQKILKDDKFGDYKAYVSLLREVVKSKSLPTLLEDARKNEFNKEIEKLIYP